MPTLGSLLPPHRRVVPGLVVAVVGTAAVAGVLLPFRSGVDAGAAGLAFVVPVVLATAIGGAPASVVAVVTGFVVFNLAFTRPYYTLEVAHVPDVVGLVVYVLVGGVTAVIVSLRQREASLARQRELEAVTVFDLSRSLISEVGLEAVLEGVAAGVVRVFAVRSAAVFVSDEEGMRLAASAGEPLPEPVLATVRAGAVGSPVLRGRAVHVFPLAAGGGLRGLLVVCGVVPDRGRHVLTTFANQAAIAVHRAELAGAATRVEVLEATDRVRGALLRSVSHDLRTPLASISAAAEDLGDAGLRLSSADRGVLTSTIAEEAARLDHLVANLLQLGRLEAGHLDVRREAVDVAELVDSAMSASHRPGVVVEIPEGLPPAHVDPLLIEQVLRNLLDNAARFSPQGAPVRVRAWLEGDRIVLAVADTGPGVAPSERERIFELFYRVDEDTAAPGGTGLGLAICRGYVSAHGGTIGVRPTPGGGATFQVAVPAARPVPDEPSDALVGGGP